ncbi:MAG TPA: MOSC domain-containing protein [Marmoricola sp.]|nr:MOSC domain-containing protein [Marmoricola sp.]
MQHRTLAELEPHLDHLRSAPADIGRVVLVACRPAPGTRELLAEGTLDLDEGLVGDGWSTRRTRTGDGRPHPDAQVTVMSARMVALLDEDPRRQVLAGDQLYVDLDLSVDNLPSGARIAVGQAVLEVTGKPHTGCAKFMRHFGEEAIRFVNGREGRRLRLRGLNARVVTPGTVRPGDAVTVIHRDALFDVRLSVG